MPKGGEILSVHVGEAGVRLGDSIWELYCVEHGIRPNGELCNQQDISALDTFFTVNSNGKCVPRAIFADTDSSSVDSIRIGKFRYLHNPRNLLSGKEDAANCFAKGYLSIGREMMDVIMNKVRTAAEEASKVQGIFLCRSAGGGTGSGMGCCLLEELRNDYKKLPMIEILVYPSPKLSTIIVEPYNALMSTHSSMETINCTLLFSNDAVYDICDKEIDITGPGMLNMNRLISQVVSAITAQFRFEGESNVSLPDLQTSLVPYPRIHFPLIGYSPLVKAKSVQHTNFTVANITNACFEPCNQMVHCNSKNGKYISCCFLYRGDVTTAEVNSALSSIRMKKSIKFVGWLPTKFKVRSLLPYIFPFVT
ncbi:UNVERIFIED_CONTAM: hypothetical protein PYX00_007001 [Menopon gallinae]|uniref:Tubulin alpha chain n=1 Tax=Menopon gallinae TaxID=328185 RepID=A0AAW2HHC4_9NEOP